ncbi:hypothetical protein AAVH_23407, partial [Aphelenchoides avenae]
MLPEIELDVLLFLDRDTLDVYQLSSAKSDQTIQRNADVLAVRVINLLQVFECYASDYHGPPCGMRFESFNRGTVCIKLSLRDSETVYEQTAFRMRNSFIQELGVSCLPCAGFLPWLYENHNVWNVCRAELIFLGSVYALFGDDKCYKHRFSDDLLPAVVDDLGITSLGFRLGSRNDQRRARQFVDSQLVPLKSLSLYVEGD